MPSASAKSLESVISKLEKLNIRPKFLEPLDRLVYAVLSDGREPAAVEKAMQAVLTVFFDWNEARVARWVEIARAFDPLENSDQGAIRLRNTLNRLFDMRGDLSMDFFEEMKISEARKAIMDIDPEFQREDINLIIYQNSPAMTPPITPELVNEAKKLGVIAKNGSKVQLQKLLAGAENHLEAVKVLHYLEMSIAQSDSAKSGSGRGAASTKKKSTRKSSKK